MDAFAGSISQILQTVDDFVWGPVMLVLLVGTGIFLTFRTRFLAWRNLGYAIRSTLSKEARTKKGTGDVSPFAALTTALAATIGTGNIVGVATAMVAGGPGALVWMWLSAAFGITSKFSECMLSIKYREINEKNEMSGGPMYTMKKGLRNKKAGSVLGCLFALFAVIASFGIGNLTQAYSISESLSDTFAIPTWITGALLTVLAMLIIVGGIKSISRVSSIVVPLMAVFYMAAGLIVIVLNIRNVPSGLAQIFGMAFSTRAVTGGFLGTIVASMTRSMRFGVARGVFSNEAGMGSAAITAATATTDQPVLQGYINMTGTFWDTIVVCSITGLCIASSGVLGSTTLKTTDAYEADAGTITLYDGVDKNEEPVFTTYQVSAGGSTLTLSSDGSGTVTLKPYLNSEDTLTTEEAEAFLDGLGYSYSANAVIGTWQDTTGNLYRFNADGTYEFHELRQGATLTIAAFRTGLGDVGAWLITVAIVLFAFSTILGWEYNGEKSLEYLLKTHKYNMVYRIIFSLVAYIGATTTLTIVWSFSDIANALMSVPNLICLLILSGEIAKDMQAFQATLKAQKETKKNRA